MKKEVFSRYERDAQGRVLIDVAAEKAEDLFSNFDRSAPYIRRDLDPHLVDYLIDCARELESAPYLICFTLALAPAGASLSRIRKSITNFFLYLASLEEQKVQEIVRRALILFLAGVVILFISVWVNNRLGTERTVVKNVFAEGLTIAAWVSLWESLATFLIEWRPLLKDVRLYRRLAAAPTIFRSGCQGMAESDEANLDIGNHRDDRQCSAIHQSSED